LPATLPWRRAVPRVSNKVSPPSIIFHKNVA
jgi:hypothetical protein